MLNVSLLLVSVHCDSFMRRKASGRIICKLVWVLSVGNGNMYQLVHQGGGVLEVVRATRKE